MHRKTKGEIFEIVLTILLVITVVTYLLAVLFIDNEATIFMATLIILVVLPTLFITYGVYKIISYESIISVITYSILILIMFYGIVNFNLIPLYKDIPYALNQDYLYIEGEVENLETFSTYRGRQTINFTINDVLFKTSDADIELEYLKEAEVIKVTYLRNSKYIINIE